MKQLIIMAIIIVLLFVAYMARIESNWTETNKNDPTLYYP